MPRPADAEIVTYGSPYGPGPRQGAGAGGSPPASPIRPPAGPEFPGCRPFRLTKEDVEAYEGRFEYWDADTETAWKMCEPTSRTHEQPSQRLAALGQVIAAVRGAPIECYGSMDLILRNERGEKWRILQADQVAYLYPGRARLPVHGLVIGEHDLPDVVVEVDHTTDVRRGKLGLYEAWGFPEVWVDVPDQTSPGRPAGRTPGLTIHLLDGDRYRKADVSRTFSGWTAPEIHAAMNEPLPSAATTRVLERVGRTLGAARRHGPRRHAVAAPAPGGGARGRARTGARGRARPGADRGLGGGPGPSPARRHSEDAGFARHPRCRRHPRRPRSGKSERRGRHGCPAAVPGRGRPPRPVEIPARPRRIAECHPPGNPFPRRADPAGGDTVATMEATSRDRLCRLVDRLPEAETHAAERYLEHLTEYDDPLFQIAMGRSGRARALERKRKPSPGRRSRGLGGRPNPHPGRGEAGARPLTWTASFSTRALRDLNNWIKIVRVVHRTDGHPSRRAPGFTTHPPKPRPFCPPWRIQI